MPLQSTGAISLEEVRNEFKSGSGSISFNELYRGGSYVPDDSFCHNNTIPSSGQISINGFYATTKGTTLIDNTSLDPIPTNAVRTQVFVCGGGGGGAFMHTAVGPVAYRASGAGGGGGYTSYTVTGLNSNMRIVGTRGGGGAGDTNAQGTFTATSGGNSVATIIRKSDGAILATFTGDGGTRGTAVNGPYQGAVTGYGNHPTYGSQAGFPTGGTGGSSSASSTLPATAISIVNGSAGAGLSRSSAETAGGSSGNPGFGGKGGNGGRITALGNVSESGQGGYVRFRF